MGWIGLASLCAYGDGSSRELVWEGYPLLSSSSFVVGSVLSFVVRFFLRALYACIVVDRFVEIFASTSSSRPASTIPSRPYALHCLARIITCIHSYVFWHGRTRSTHLRWPHTPPSSAMPAFSYSLFLSLTAHVYSILISPCRSASWLFPTHLTALHRIWSLIRNPNVYYVVLPRVLRGIYAYKYVVGCSCVRDNVVLPLPRYRPVLHVKPCKPTATETETELQVAIPVRCASLSFSLSLRYRRVDGSCARVVRLDEHLAELLELGRPADLLGEERELDDVEELVVELVRLVQVLLLHLVPDLAVLAVGAGLGEEELVDDDVVRVDLVRGELLHEPLGFVQGEELGDADADEGRLFLDTSTSRQIWFRGA